MTIKKHDVWRVWNSDLCHSSYDSTAGMIKLTPLFLVKRA